MDAQGAAGIGRADALARILIGCLLGVAGPLLLWPAAVLQVALPATIAGHVARGGGERFLREDAPRILDALEWLLGLRAWAALVATAPPWADGPREVRLRAAVPATARGPGRALARIVTTLPAAVAQALVGAAALVPWLVSVACVLATGRHPAVLRRLQARALAGPARLLLRQALLDGP